MANDLKQWAKDNNPNLVFEPGESITVVYKGYKIVPDAFNPGKEKVQYEVETEDGKTKFWNNGSGRVAMFFSGVEEGGLVTITATGEGMKRRYEIEKANLKK